MNMPKRASCHHFMRRMRSASSASEAACGCAAGVPGSPSAASALREAPSVRSVALVANNQSRRGIRFGPMIWSLLGVALPFAGRLAEASRGMIGSWHLLFKLEDFFHQQPLFTRLGPRKHLLELPHQLFPLAHLRIFAISLRFSLERELLIDLHHHEHTRAKQIDLHILDSGIFDTQRDLRPDFLVVVFVFGDKLRVVFQIQRQTIAPYIHFASRIGADSGMAETMFGL